MEEDGEIETAETLEDRLGWTIRFLRAAEDVRLQVMERCAQAYPRLRDMADARNPLCRERGMLSPVRAHAVELAREAALDEIRVVEKQDAGREDLDR